MGAHHLPCAATPRHGLLGEKDGRATAFRNYRLVNVPKAGHWVHHDQLEIFLRTVREFLVL